MPHDNQGSAEESHAEELERLRERVAALESFIATAKASLHQAPDERGVAWATAALTAAASPESANAKPPSKRRADYLPLSSLAALHLACSEVMRAYDDTLGVYLVGSCLNSKDYRDVDVRCILRDDAFEALFPFENDAGSRVRPRWQLICLSISIWMSNLTGLPIDFQFQKQTIANAKHRGPRNALGYFNFMGDATH